MSPLETRALWAPWGLSVGRTVRPTSPAQVAEALALCLERKESVLPVGAGLSLASGGAPGPCDVALLLDGLSGVIDYSPGDMTITVLAGTPLDTIRQTLAPHGQRLPGMPRDQGTIGGLVATGWTSAEAREAQGAVRERLLGVQVADARGYLTRSGGRVVKNVTGYDLHRMHVGACGAFGVLTELTFRLEPKPEFRAEVTLEAPTWEAARDAWRWLRWDGPETSFLGLRRVARGLEFVALLEGDEEPARRGTETLTKQWNHLGFIQSRELDGGPPKEGLAPEPKAGAVRLAAALRAAPSRALALFERVTSDPALVPLSVDSACYLQAGEICLILEGSATDLIDRVGALAESARDGGPAYRIQEERPSFLPPELPRWSADPGAFRLLARIKQALDPQGILRPGSYSAEALARAALYFSTGAGSQ